MSKRKRKKFDAPTQLPAKYYQNLKQAPSDETARPSPDIREDLDYGATDSVIPDDSSTLSPAPGGWEMPKYLKNICLFGPALAAILWFFWGLNASVDSIKTDTGGMNEKMTVLTQTLEDTSKDLITEQNDIKVVLEKIIGKINRLFDNVSFLQKSGIGSSTTIASDNPPKE